MNFRQKIMRGEVLLLAHQVSSHLGIQVPLIFVIRVIGPRQYSIYAASAGIVGFLSGFGSLGTDYYPLREGVPSTDDDLHQASTLLLYVTLVIGGAVFLPAGIICHHLRIPETAPIIPVGTTRGGYSGTGGVVCPAHRGLESDYTVRKRYHNFFHLLMGRGK